jgi:hypothetical protein
MRVKPITPIQIDFNPKVLPREIRKPKGVPRMRVEPIQRHNCKGIPRERECSVSDCVWSEKLKKCRKFPTRRSKENRLRDDDDGELREILARLKRDASGKRIDIIDDKSQKTCSKLTESECHKKDTYCKWAQGPVRRKGFCRVKKSFPRN